jgi:hypothetical protein
MVSRKLLPLDHLLVKFDWEMLKIVPGGMSTETDARSSFDVEGPRVPQSHKVSIFWRASLLRSAEQRNATCVRSLAGGRSLERGSMDHFVSGTEKSLAREIAFIRSSPRCLAYENDHAFEGLL